MIGQSGVMSVAPVDVVTSSGRGHSPETITDLCLRRLMGIANTAPEPIRSQAFDFRDRIRPLLVYYMKQAIRSDRTTLHNQLKSAGQHEAAALVLKL